MQTEPTVAVGGIGQFVPAVEIDEHGCPVERIEVFPSDMATIYVATETSRIRAGDAFHTRTYRGGILVDEGAPIQADSDVDACIWFWVTPLGDRFIAGHYTVELVRNGSVVDWTQYAVAE